eukprot:TRINITY_DN37722_c0_g1_i1.p1 TRINITY_DN37722_c0_g1~~TRINITY_DN37722_c0_g1_i1.p1  ORF type:complete len:553 (-),score=131.15 TRINITY_DN37722_c0_g1_i1:80-1738(-)
MASMFKTISDVTGFVAHSGLKVAVKQSSKAVPWELTPWPSSKDLKQQIIDNVGTGDKATMNRLLDTALATQAFEVPGVKELANTVAVKQLREAVQSADRKRLQGALIAAKRLQATNLPEYARALAKYKEVARIPDDWDVPRLVQERKGGKLMIRAELSDKSSIALFQKLFDSTLRTKWTRDRKEDLVPSGFEVVAVRQVQNEAKWMEYVVRQEQIRRELAKELGELPVASAAPAPGASAAARGSMRKRCQYAAHQYKQADADADSAAASGKADAAPAASDDKAGGEPPEVQVWKTASFGKRASDGESDDSEGEQEDADTVIGADTLGVATYKAEVTLPGPNLDNKVSEVYLFHGTHPLAAEKITADNFSVNLAGSCTGTLYGRGLYFAEHCTKADEYTRPDDRGLHTILISRVTLGKAFRTAELEPDACTIEEKCMGGSYHSICGDRIACRDTFREFVVFDEAQVYPNFVVQYKRKTLVNCRTKATTLKAPTLKPAPVSPRMPGAMRAAATLAPPASPRGGLRTPTLKSPRGGSPAPAKGAGGYPSPTKSAG